MAAGENDQGGGLSETLDIANTVTNAAKGGKVIAGLAKGAAAGGPYGAVLLGLWENRKTAAKAFMAAGLVFLLPVVFIMMLPSIIFNGFDSHNAGSALNSQAAISRNLAQAEAVIRAFLTEQKNAVIEEIRQKIASLNSNERGVLVDQHALAADSYLLLSQYSAATDYKSINLDNLRQVVGSINENMYSYAETVNKEVSDDIFYDSVPNLQAKLFADRKNHNRLLYRAARRDICDHRHIRRKPDSIRYQFCIFHF